MSASLENIRAKAEEFRTRIKTRVEGLRGGGGTRSGILGNFSSFSSPELMKGPLLTEIREKGVLATARSRMEKMRGAAPASAAQGRGEETITPPATNKGVIYS